MFANTNHLSNETLLKRYRFAKPSEILKRFSNVRLPIHVKEQISMDIAHLIDQLIKHELDVDSVIKYFYELNTNVTDRNIKQLLIAIQTYINSNDFNFPGKNITKSWLWGQVSYRYENKDNAAMKILNDSLSHLIEDYTHKLQNRSTRKPNKSKSKKTNVDNSTRSITCSANYSIQTSKGTFYKFALVALAIGQNVVNAYQVVDATSHDHNGTHGIVDSSYDPSNIIQNHAIDTRLVFSTPIRVCFSGAINSGDQANTILIMQRMRDLGFSGTYEVIYSDAKKIQTLFDFKGTIPDTYEETGNKMVFRTLQNQKKLVAEKKLEKTNLSFSVTGNMNDNVCDTRITNSESYLQFVPYAAFKDTWHPTIMQIKDGPGAALPNSSAKFFHFKVATLQDANLYLSSDKGKELLENNPALPTFISGMQEQNFNVLPVYGRTLRFTNQANSEDTSPNNILLTIAGAQHAKLKIAPDKPLIITVYGVDVEYANNIRKLLNDNKWGMYEREGSSVVRVFLQKLKLNETVVFADLTQPDLADVIKNLAGNQILFLTIKGLPLTVFNALFHYHASNVWPKILEGAASINVAVMQPYPFLRCGDKTDVQDGTLWNFGVDNISDNKLKEDFSKLYDPATGYCGGDSFPMADPYVGWMNTVYKLLGKFIIQSQDPNSAFVKYFQELNKKVMNVGDRVEYALDNVENALKK